MNERDSQFPDTPLGNSVREHVNDRLVFYKEYVCSDHGHERLCPIPKVVALGMISASPYEDVLSNYMVSREDWDDSRSKVVDIMNKGAIRITPTMDLYEALKDKDEQEWGHKDYGCQWGEVWVYKHDSTWWITSPRKESK
jgi:hypothetical protein